MSVYVIAEIGPNHNGDLAIARRMIDRLAPSGADAIKFQLAVPENVYSRDAYKAGYQVRNDGAGSVIEMSRRVQLPARDHIQLYQDCRERGVAYMCTAFDMTSLAFLDEHFEMPYFKVPSGEILTIDMLEYMAGRSRPIIVSTGMARFDEIDRSVQCLEADGAKDITLLHCVSNYPTPPEDVNLNVMPELARRFGRPVGFSDHTLGNDCAIAAVALGATVIEKHVTLDKSMDGPDHKASATVEEFTDLVRSIRAVEAALGSTEKVFSQAEDGVRDMARKSIAATRDLAPGDRIAAGDICFKRPGTGIAPMDRDTVIGRVVKRAVGADRLIRREDLA